jgi:hypothetical protein
MNRRPTHFATLGPGGRSHIRPLVTNRPTPKVDLLARIRDGRRAHAAGCCCETCHPTDHDCAMCDAAREKAREAVDAMNAETRRRAEIARHFETFEPATFLTGPEGSSALDR